jgi:hypothetical protein
MAPRPAGGTVEHRRQAASIEVLETIMIGLPRWLGRDRRWRDLRTYLARRLAGHPASLTDCLERSLNSTIDGICEMIIESFRATAIPLHWSTETIRRNTAAGEKAVLVVRSFPLSWLSGSPIIHDAVVANLLGRVDLDAARKGAGLVDDDEWRSVIEGYAAGLLRDGVEVALRRMAARDVALWAGYVVLAIEEAEDDRGDMVKVYDPPIAYYANKPGLSRARRIWDRRRSPGYRHVPARDRDRKVRIDRAIPSELAPIGLRP